MWEVTGKAVSILTEDWKAPGKQDEIYVLYSRLDRFRQKIYEVMLDLGRGVMIREDYVCELLIPAKMYIPDVWGTRLYYMYFAVLLDHPELFWMRSYYPDIRYQTGNAYGGNYIRLQMKLEGDHSRLSHHLAQFENAAKSILQKVDRSGPADRAERQIHDTLLALINYDHQSVDQDVMFAFSAYGALVRSESGLANHAVCMGYAQAFQLLLQRCHIPAATVVGEAYPFEEEGKPHRGHAWNIVCLDGEWYEVDLCFDDVLDLRDPGLDPSIRRRVTKDPKHTENCRHQYFNLTTKQMLDRKPGKEHILRSFLDSQYIPIVRMVHKRYGGLSADQVSEGGVYDYLCRLLPQAAGTKYAYRSIP